MRSNVSYPKDHPRGFLPVVGGFLAQFVVFGMLAAFPAFIGSLEKDATLGKPTRTQISLVNSLASGPGPIVAGVLGGLVLDTVGARPVIVLNVFLFLFAMLIPSFAAHSYGALIAMYSIPTTITIGLCNGPITTIVSDWFDKRMGLAMGIATAGGGAGSAVLPLVSGALLTYYDNDWRPAWRVLASLDFLLLTAAILLVRRPLGPGETRDASSASSTTRAEDPKGELNSDGEASLLIKVEVSSQSSPSPVQKLVHELKAAYRLIKGWTFVSIFLSAALFGIVYTGILFVTIPLALDFGKAGTMYAAEAPISITKASALYTGFGISQTIGSLILGPLGDKTEPKYMFGFASAIAAIGLSIMAAASTYFVLFLGFCVVGFAFAANWAMFPAMLTERFGGPQLGMIMGIGYMAIGVGALIGPPSSSAIADTHGSYQASLYFFGIVCAVGAIFSAFVIPSRTNKDAVQLA